MNKKGVLYGFLFILFVIIFISVFMGEDNDTEQVKQVFSDKPIEYKLAIINAGGYIDEDDITVNRFRSLLEQLSHTYIENRQQVADMTVTAKELLRKEGIKENLLNIMEGMNQLFSQPIENQEYAKYAAMYVTLRRNGRSHSQAIGDIRAILEVLGTSALNIFWKR